jgi:hypothetical protein
MGLTFRHCVFQSILIKSKVTKVAEDKVELALFIDNKRFAIIRSSFCL